MDTSRNEVRVAALRRRVAATACALAWTYTSVAHAQTRTVYARVETGQHAGWIKALDIDQAERHVVTVSLDKTARVWNLQSGKLERILRPPIGDVSGILALTIRISAIPAATDPASARYGR